jgi:hypothetical protein
MTADPLRLMRQYRRPRTRVGRAFDRARFWVREQLIPISLLVGTLAIPATAVLIQAGAAQATPVDTYTITAGPTICEVLDEYPSLAGVTGVVQGVVNDSGFTPYDAGTVVAESVIIFCPTHLPLLHRYVAVYGDNTTGLVLR